MPKPITPAARKHAESLADFVLASPSSYHAAEEVARRLEGEGFVRLHESAEWPTQSGGKFAVVRDGAAIAWAVPADATATTPANVLGTHTDSPGFKIKPNVGVTTQGWREASVEVYGGPILSSWFDRELRVAGRLALADGSVTLAATGPLLRIPNLAIHLGRDPEADKQLHTQPVWGLDDGETDSLLGELAAATGVAAGDIRGFDLFLADSNPGQIFGQDDAFFASGRLDNLASTFAGVVALTAATVKQTAGAPIAMFGAFDHEELGSNSRSGAAGPFLEDVLDRVYASLGASVDDRKRATANSWHLSSDVGHSVHPNYAGKHDPNVKPVLGSGPILKLNANQRYATDAPGTAAWLGWAAAAGVVTQDFVSNNSVPCGSTIGPITATRLGIRTIDVGIPILSMHSARELAGVSDLHDLALIVEQFFAG